MILSLLWKEYRDYRWPVLLCTPLICTLDYFCRRNTTDTDASLLILILQTIIFAVFIASTVIAGEQSRGTHLTFHALPTPRFLPTAVKVFAGLVALLIPLLAVVFVAMVTLDPHDLIIAVDGQHLLFIFTSALGIYAWTLFLAASCRTRTGVLIIGAVVVCISFLNIISVAAFDPRNITLSDRSILYLTPILLTVNAIDLSPFQNRFWIRTFVLLSVLFLGWLKIARQRPVEESPALLPARRLHASTCLRPRNQYLPIVWKAYREIRNLAVGVIAINAFFAVAMTAIIYSYERSHYNRDLWKTVILPGIATFGSLFWVASGSILAIAMGVRITGNAFRPKAAGFWQSRPIRAPYYLESQAVAGVVAILLGCSLFGLFAWTITPNLADGRQVLAAAQLAFCIQILMFPVTLIVGTFVRTTLLNASISASILIVVFLAAAVLNRKVDAFSPWAIGAALVAILVTTLLWQKHPNVQPAG